MCLRLVIVFVIGLSAFNAKSAVPTLPCSSCSDIQKERLAKTVGRFGRVKHVVIMDYQNEVATKYSISITQDRYGQPLHSVYPQAMTNDEIHDANIIFEIRRVYLEMITGAQKLPIFNMYGDPIEQTVNGSYRNFKPESYQKPFAEGAYVTTGELIIIGDPYDFMSTSSIRNRLFDYYATGAKGTLDGLISSTLKKLDIPFVSNMDITIKINFFDIAPVTGEVFKTGLVVIQADFIMESFDVLKAEDRDDNTIPQSNDDLKDEQFIFRSVGSRDAFLNYYGFSPSGSSDDNIDCVLTKTSSNGNNHIFTYNCG